MSPLGIQEVRWDATSSPVQNGGELSQLDRYLAKLAGGATSKDDLFDRVTSHFRIRIRVELNYRRRRDRSFNSTLIRMRKWLVTRSNRSSFDVAPPASLAKYRSSCDSSPPFWTGLLVASQRTSWIPRGLILTRST